MKQIAVILALLPLFTFAKVITVVDSTDTLPVSGGTVIASSGMIRGFTDNNGNIDVNQHDFPLSVRSLGYESAIIGDVSADTIYLTPAVYSLQEVVVDPNARPVTRVLAYAREYCTGATTTDTLQIYSEYMLEYFFDNGKVKGFNGNHRKASQRNVRRYGRIAKASGDSIFRPAEDDDITMLSFVELLSSIPYKQQAEPKAIKEGERSIDTVAGKFYPKFIYRKSDNLFTVECDALADYKEHKMSHWLFKMFGFTMDMHKVDRFLAYKTNRTGKYGLYDFIYETYNLSILGKGKMLKRLFDVKEEIAMDCCIEVYPVEINQLTPEDYAEIKKEFKARHSEFILPENIDPLPTAIQNIIDRQ